MDSASDHALMTKVKNGDLDKLGLLFERYNRRLFGFFYRMTLRPDLSEDLVQGVFERILKYRGSYTGKGNFTTWIFAVARNHHADYYRKNEVNTITNGEVDWDSLPGEGSDSYLQPEKDLNRWLVQQALEKLEPEKKQALVLSRYEGFRYREIAEIMNCTESAVKVRVFRALNEMKEIITDLRKKEEL